MARLRDLASSAADLPTPAALPIMAPSIIFQSARAAAAGAREGRTHPEDEQKKMAFERTGVRCLPLKAIRQEAHHHDLTAYVGSPTPPKPRGTFRQFRRSA